MCFGHLKKYLGDLLEIALCFLVITDCKAYSGWDFSLSHFVLFVIHFLLLESKILRQFACFCVLLWLRKLSEFIYLHWLSDWLAQNASFCPRELEKWPEWQPVGFIQKCKLLKKLAGLPGSALLQLRVVKMNKLAQNNEYWLN